MSNFQAIVLLVLIITVPVIIGKIQYWRGLKKGYWKGYKESHEDQKSQRNNLFSTGKY